MWQIPVGIGVGVWYSDQSLRRAVTATGITLAASAVIRSIGWRAAGSALWTAGMTPIAYVAGAVIGGALVGTAVSYALFGKEGAKAAVDFYTDPLDLEKGKTILAAPSNLSAIMQADRAVENNAAGLPAGTRIGDSYLPGGRGNPAHSQYQESGAVTGYREMYGY